MQHQFLKRPIIMFLLFITIVGVYTSFIRTWECETEDFILLYQSALVHTPNDFLDFFIHGDVEHRRIPTYLSNVGNDLNNLSLPSFFSVYYRPLHLIANYIMYTYFGMNEYGYFVTAIIFHALISILLFFLLSLFTNPISALLATLFFAFHPTLGYWLGKIDLMQHHLGLIFGVLTIITFYQWTKKTQWRYFIIMLFSFFLSLMSRETLVFLPCLILPVLFQIKSKKSTRFLAYSTIIGFSSVFIIYAIFRGLAYPITLKLPIFRKPPPVFIDQSSVFNTIKNIYQWFYDLFWTLHFPPHTYAFFKSYNLSYIYAAIKALIITFVGYLFVINEQKKLVLLALASGIIFLWPIYAAGYIGGYRLFYEPLIFFIAAYALLINVPSPNYKTKIAGYMLIGTLIAVGATYNIICMKKHIRERHNSNLKIIQLKKEMPYLYNKPIFIFGSYLYSLDLIHAFELYDVTGPVQHLYLPELVIAPQQTSAKNFTAHVTEQGVRIKTKNKHIAWLKLASPRTCLFEKNIVIHEQNQYEDIFDISIEFKERYIKKDMNIVVFSEIDQKFIVL